MKILYRETKTKCLTQLLKEREHLTTLRLLPGESFNGLESLLECLGNITYLETLVIVKCKNLKSLSPKEAMSNLTGLKKFTVFQCSQLELGEGSFERAKVFHVARIHVF